jgi:hypothetical protein
LLEMTIMRSKDKASLLDGLLCMHACLFSSLCKGLEKCADGYYDKAIIYTATINKYMWMHVQKTVWYLIMFYKCQQPMTHILCSL